MNPSEKAGDTISLGLALDTVMLTQGAAAHLLQWMAQQIGTDTEAGAALRDSGIAIGQEDITPARTSSSTAHTSSTSKT